MVMGRQKRYLPVSPEAVSDTRGQFKLLSKLDLRGGLIDTKCESNFSRYLLHLIESFLKALQPHKIRVLYLHRPDRSVPFENTLREINKLHQERKFELFGLSNYPAWEVSNGTGTRYETIKHSDAHSAKCKGSAINGWSGYDSSLSNSLA